MQFNVAFAIFAMIASALAAPTVTELSDRAAEVDGTLFVCTDNNWSGACTTLGFYVDQCNDMPSNYQDNISSFGPSAGWECTVYT
ncbi:hypothetical protein BDQ17DRAFT_1434424 [Cyathus striatus]|nr:hypothetical protein BDQ17DRAFT_1434424 [Cyathus striatus]